MNMCSSAKSLRFSNPEGAPSRRRLEIDEGLDSEYIEHLAATLPTGLAGMRIIVDAAHGAASFLAPALFERLGAVIECIGCEPDGRNINLNCGSLHLEGLRERACSRPAPILESLSMAMPTGLCSFRIRARSSTVMR